MDDETEVLLRTRLFDAESALAELVRLKDGPRDGPYKQAKLLAWSRARAVLAQLVPEIVTDQPKVDVTWYYGIQRKYRNKTYVRPEGEGQAGLDAARQFVVPEDGDVVVGQRVSSVVDDWVPISDDCLLHPVQGSP